MACSSRLLLQPTSRWVFQAASAVALLNSRQDHSRLELLLCHHELFIQGLVSSRALVSKCAADHANYAAHLLPLLPYLDLSSQLNKGTS